MEGDKKKQFEALFTQSREKRNSTVENVNQWERERNVQAFYDSQGKNYEITAEDESFKIVIEEEPGVDIGARVWDLALVLCKFCEMHADLFKGKRIIELGAGTGIVGLFLSFLEVELVVATDLPRVLAYMHRQLPHNEVQFKKLFDKDLSSVFKIRELTWGKDIDSYENENFDLIIVSDVAAPVGEVPNFIQSIKKLLEVNPNSKMLIAANRIREFTPEFLEQGKEVFNFDTIEKSEHHPKYISERCLMYWITLK